MSDAGDKTPYYDAESNMDIHQTDPNIDGEIQMAGQANIETEVGSTDAQQERNDDMYHEDVGEEVIVEQEHGGEAHEGENRADSLPLNLQLASNTNWGQRSLLGLDLDDGISQHNTHRQRSAYTSTNSYTDCGFPPQLGTQAQQQARGESGNTTRQQHSTYFDTECFSQNFGRSSMSLQTPSSSQYQSHAGEYGRAGGLSSMSTLEPNTAFGQRAPMPSAFMPAASVPSALLTYSSMPNWANQPSLPPQLGPLNWSDPLTTSRNVGSVRDFYRQSGVVEEVHEISDDGEPLATRVQRHRSVTLSATDRSPHPRTASADVESPIHDIQDGIDEDWHGETHAHGHRVDSARKATRPNQHTSSISSEPEEMSWKLPPYEALYVPPTTQDDLPLAKVSIPGLVREELLLSPDHTTQEFVLFEQVFLPAQQALVTPDPEPAHAVLNFHTIAVLVVEAFTQYEIGDEVSHGPSPRAPTAPDVPFSRQHSAKDADVDAIFFAVIDRWRAGLESNKQPLRLIRGAQEFCDIALDVIHYIKEHGLETPEQPGRKQRKDKGVARGPRKKDAQTEAGQSGAGAKGKRKAGAEAEAAGSEYANANTLPARKKVKSDKEKDKGKTGAKTGAKPGPKPGPKPKAMAKTKTAPRGSKAKSGGITVIQWKK
jgi:hypothetical protein